MTITRRKKYPGIRKRGDNTYEINFYVGKKRVTKNIKASSELEAAKVRLQMMAEALKDSNPLAKLQTKHFTFDEAFQYYLNNTAKLLNETTRQRSECIFNHLKNFVAAGYPSIKYIDEITPSIGNRYKDYLLSSGTGRTASGINTDISKLRAIFSRFCEYEFIESNPFKQVSKIPRRLARPEKKYLPSDEDIRKILKLVLKMNEYVEVTKFLIRVGRRIEETSSYYKSDVIKDVSGQPVAIQVRPEITKTKEPGELPLDDELSQIVNEALLRNPENPYLFTNPFRRKIAQNSYREFLKEICGEAKVTAITPHCFRYYAINKMTEAGVNVRDAMVITGHVDLESYMSYLKSTEEGRYRALAVTRLDKLFGGSV